MAHQGVHPPSGVGADPDAPLVTARGYTFPEGAVGQLDFGLTDSNVLDNVEGGADSGFSNAILPADPFAGTVLGVFQYGCADGKTDRFVIRSNRVLAVVGKASGDIAAGALLGPTTGGILTADVTQGMRYCAICLEAVTAPGLGTLAYVRFNGETGFGTKVIA